MAKDQSYWVQIAKDSSLKESKRKKAILKITDHNLLLEVASHLYEHWDKPLPSNCNEMAERAMYKVIENATLEDLQKYNLVYYIDRYMVNKITDQDILYCLTKLEKFKDPGEGLAVCELALEKIADPNKKAVLGEKLQTAKNNRIKAATAGANNNAKSTSILDKYRAGLSYLDGCESFDEAKFREFNRIAGNRFSEADIQTQLKNSELMLKGMEEVKQVLRSNMVEAINTFEKLEREGVDLSKYDI